MGDIRHRWLVAIAAVALAMSPLGARNVAADGLAVDDAYTVAEDPPGGLPVSADVGLLANDTGGSLVLCVVSVDATNLAGTLDQAGASDGSFTYAPPPNFNGTTTFTYVVATKVADACPAPPVNDGTATVTITVTPANDPPTAAADTFTALKDRTLNVAAPGVLANDSDIDGDTLTAIKTSSPSHGTVTLAADGSFSYTPDSGYVGTDAFSYQANDGTSNSPQRLVNLNIVAVPPPATPTPNPTPVPVPPTASPEPSPTESPEPSDSGLPSPSPLDTGLLVSASPSTGPVVGPVASGGGPSIVAIGALALIVGLLAVAAWYFVRSQRSDDEDDDPEPEFTGGGFDPDDRGADQP